MFTQATPAFRWSAWRFKVFTSNNVAAFECRGSETVFEEILRPLVPLPLAEHQHVKVTVSELPGDSLAEMIDETFLEYARKEVAAADHIPTLEEVRRMAGKDRGSWAEAIIAGRGAFLIR
jgi:hypothetical protein